MVDMCHVSMGIINVTKVVYKTWLYQTFLTVINMQTNGAVSIEHPLNYIDEKTTAHWKNPHHIFLGMVNFPALMNSENLCVTYIPSYQNLRN